MKPMLTHLAALLVATATAWSVPPLNATVSSDQVLEKDFLGFGVEWGYEGNRPDNNLNNSVWTKHWPERFRADGSGLRRNPAADRDETGRDEPDSLGGQSADEVA